MIHEGRSRLMCSDLRADAEHEVLTTESGRSLLAEVAWVKLASPADVTRWRRRHTGDHVSAALRVVDARRRGRAKFDRAEIMWFEAVGLEQATAEPVARHKAVRFQDALVFDVCSGIGGDSLALAHHADTVVSVDIDPAMARRTRYNAEVYGVGHRVFPIIADATTIEIPDQALVHIDPDRRVRTTGRARSIAHYVPDLEFLKRLIRTTRGGAIKLSPASDFREEFGQLAVELEVISLDGECKETTVWFGALAKSSQRATCIRNGIVSTWTDRDAAEHKGTAELACKVLAWVYDPDPALVRAGLLEGFARAHGLKRVAAGCDFLTSDERVESPFLSAFEVDDTMPFDMKKLKKHVAERELGPLEIKTKGIDARPEDVRKALDPEGPNPATILLMGGTGSSLAIVARRV
jgi:predicted RNA methylase